MKFDFGWLFNLGDAAHQELCPATAFMTFDKMYCEGWGHQAAYQLQEDECRIYCCGDPSCAGYVYKDGWCAVGNSLSGCVSGDYNSTGGIRTVPAAIVQPPASGPQSTSFDDSHWRTLDVPHDFIVETLPGPDDEWNHGFRPKNVSWYRKHFELDASFANRSVYLEFDGVFRSSDMWLNGEFLGHHSSGYTSFRHRIDNVPGVQFGGKNVLAIRVDPRGNEGWWYEGGGVYRHTWLTVAAPVHIAQYGVYVPSNVTGPVDRSSGKPRADATVSIFTDLENFATASDAEFSVTSEIFDPSGNSVWSADVPVVGAKLPLSQTAELKAALLWEQDPEGSALYTLVSTLVQGGSAVDSVNTTFGVRKLGFDSAKGFFLNDQSVKVKGMCNHQDFAGVGTAVPDRLQEFRVDLLQSFGVNAWRMSHNPPNPELLDIADRKGLLVWDENRMFGDFETWYTDMADLIKRDRNHPSVIWWSLCNEYGCLQLSDNVTLTIGKRFRDIIKSLDPSRPISGAWNGEMDLGYKWSQQVTDMFGINYNYQAYDPFHTTFPGTPLISSESCSCTSDRSNEVNDTMALVGTFHAWSCLKDCWQPVADREFVQGSFDWTGFDYRGEETPTKWPATNSHFGIVDLAGYLKDAGHYYKAQFNLDVPVVHIAPNTWEYSNFTVLNYGNLMSRSCVANSALQGWEVVPVGNGNVMLRSKANPGQCIEFFGNAYPGRTKECDTTNADQVFRFDNGAIVHGQNWCMDVNGGVGPAVGFYHCNGQDNQKFTLSSSGALQEAGSLSGQCVTYDDGSSVEVWVYTNAAEVELFLNGASLGNQTVAKYDKGTFLVPYAPGNLTAVGYTASGQPWGQNTLVTPGAGARVRLVVDYGTEKGLKADGQDVLLLTASLVDEFEVTLHAANDEVTFTVTGPGVLIGAGNGDPSDHTPEGRTGSPSRRVWNGRVRAIVQAGTTAGDITVVASAAGYKSASVTVTSTLP